jgi:hypothetical protein
MGSAGGRGNRFSNSDMQKPPGQSSPRLAHQGPLDARYCEWAPERQGSPGLRVIGFGFPTLARLARCGRSARRRAWRMWQSADLRRRGGIGRTRSAARRWAGPPSPHALLLPSQHGCLRRGNTCNSFALRTCRTTCQCRATGTGSHGRQHIAPQAAASSSSSPAMARTPGMPLPTTRGPSARRSVCIFSYPTSSGMSRARHGRCF